MSKTTKKLRTYDVSLSIFNQIYEFINREEPKYCIKVNSYTDFQAYTKGTEDYYQCAYYIPEDNSKYTGHAWMMIRTIECQIALGKDTEALAMFPNRINRYEQIILHKVPGLPGRNINTSRAGTEYFKIVKDKYKELTNKDIKDRLKEYDVYTFYKDKEYAKPLHKTLNDTTFEYKKPNRILHFTNCLYIDINGAHADAMREAIPELKDFIEDVYSKRKEIPQYKNILNFFVGMAKNKGYEGIWYWTTFRTRSKVLNKYYELSNKKDMSDVIYANTDGIIIQNPKYIPESSKELGEFKVEHYGDVYMYSNVNNDYSRYSVLQYIDKESKYHTTTGSALPTIFHDKIDLVHGKVIQYSTKRVIVNKVNRAYNTQYFIEKEQTVNIWKK